MPRDMDFRPRRRAASTSHAPARSNRRSSSAGLGWLILIGLIIAGGALYINNQPKTNTTNQPVNTSTATEEATELPTTDGETKVVQVYLSGAGDEDLTNSIETLKQAGWDARSLGKSQLDYDQTYIWYSSEKKLEAEELAGLLSSRQVSLKESQLSGSFGILIYLGKK